MPNSSGDIKDILAKISSERNLPKAESGELEFELGVRKSEPISEEKIEPPEEDVKSDVSADDGEEADAEIPDIFNLAETEDQANTDSENIYRFRTTYMPRFEDIEITSDSAPVDVGELDGERIDPMAELHPESSPDAIEVTVDNKEDLIDESTTVFKFSDEEAEQEADLPLEETAPSEVVVTEKAEEASVAQITEEKSEPPRSDSEEPKQEAEKVPEKEPEKVPEKAPEKALEKVPEKAQEKVPEIYVPTEVSLVEHIKGVGDPIKGENSKNEYNSVKSRESLKDKFIDTILSIKVRLCVAIVLAIGVFAFENVRLLGIDLASLFRLNAVNGALAIIDMQFVICLFLVTLPEVIPAIKRIAFRSLTSEILILPAFAVYLIYTISVISVAASGDYVLLGFMFSVFAVFVIVSSLYKKSADFKNFKKVSSPEIKTVVDNKPTRTLERENIALDGVIEEHKSKTARTFKTEFVADFFHRTNKSSEKPERLLFLIFVPLGVALLIALLVFFIYDKTYTSLITNFSVIYMFSLPVFSVITYRLPYFHAAEEALSGGGVIIGESSMHDYSGVDVICFEDTEVFSEEDVNIQRIMLYGNNENLTKAVRQMSALFMNVGGPLDAIFSGSLDRKCEPARSVCIKENGISAELDGKKIMAGNYEYMISEGANIPEDKEEQTAAFGSTKTMYAAENGVVYAKFLICYRFSEEFTMLLSQMREAGITPLVYTRDPNVNGELFKTLTAGTTDVRVLKKTSLPHISFAPSKISAGMVIDGEKECLVNMIILSKKYVKLESTVKITERAALIAALALGALLSFGGMLSAYSVPMLSLWQISWCVALYIMSKSVFRILKKDKEKDAK